MINSNFQVEARSLIFAANGIQGWKRERKGERLHDFALYGLGNASLDFVQ